MRAAESVDSQSVSVGELIVVNDGSNCSYTNAEQKLHELSVDIKYLKTENQGAAAARNVGAKQANGEVLMFLDDDDRWRQYKVEGQLNCFKEDTGLVYSGRIVVDMNGNELYRIDKGMDGDLSDDILACNHIGTTSNPAIHAGLFQSVGGFDEQLPGLQDWELWIRLCQKTLVEYDTSYSIEWTYHPTSEDQMAGQVDRYLRAVEILQKKYSSRYKNLNWIRQNKIWATHNKIIAKKYAQNNSNNKYKYIIRSLLHWPSISVVAWFLPNSLHMKFRPFLKSWFEYIT